MIELGGDGIASPGDDRIVQSACLSLCAIHRMEGARPLLLPDLLQKAVACLQHFVNPTEELARTQIRLFETLADLNTVAKEETPTTAEVYTGSA